MASWFSSWPILSSESSYPMVCKSPKYEAHRMNPVIKSIWDADQRVCTCIQIDWTVGAEFQPSLLLFWLLMVVDRGKFRHPPKHGWFGRLNIPSAGRNAVYNRCSEQIWSSKNGLFKAVLQWCWSREASVLSYLFDSRECSFCLGLEETPRECPKR